MEPWLPVWQLNPLLSWLLGSGHLLRLPRQSANDKGNTEVRQHISRNLLAAEDRKKKTQVLTKVIFDARKL